MMDIMIMSACGHAKIVVGPCQPWTVFSYKSIWLMPMTLWSLDKKGVHWKGYWGRAEWGMLGSMGIHSTPGSVQLDTEASLGTKWRTCTCIVHVGTRACMQAMAPQAMHSVRPFASCAYHSPARTCLVNPFN